MESKPTTNNETNVFGEVCVRKQRRKRQKLLIIELLHDYAENSTLHGLRYIVKRGLYAIEKSFWLLTFLMSVGMCFFLISNVWVKWRRSPVIVSFSEKVVPVGDVPFPSITVCPQLKCKATVFNYSHEYQKYLNSYKKESPSKVSEKLFDIHMLCDKGMMVLNPNRKTFGNSSIIENFLEVAPNASDVFRSCQWRAKPIDCDTSFKSVLTSEGICFNFNALAASEILNEETVQADYKYLNTSKVSRHWNIIDGYSDFDIDETYPRRGIENNALPDLRFILMEEPKNRDNLCNTLRSGYTIYVQHPADLPQASLYYYAALPGQVSSLALKFNMLTTSDNLKKYSAEDRQCYFQENKPLKYFKIYTPSNCRLECQSIYTFKKCGCVWFHMPHNDSRSICTTSDHYECYINATDELSLAELRVKGKNMKTEPCHCLPFCDSVQYDAEILKTDFNIHTYLLSRQEMYGVNLSEFTSKNMSLVEIYFKEPRFISMRRSELFGITDFLANCGGLLGLFFGFSFLSLVEMFYFVTIRLYYILRRDLKEEKKNRNREEEKY